MSTAETLEAARDAVEDGLRNAVTRDEYIRWQKALVHLVQLELLSSTTADQ